MTVTAIFTMLMVFISVAFFTLMERKMIGLSQNRKGPSKSAFMGIMQPMSDFIKLSNKEINLKLKSNKIMFSLSPSINIISSMTLWMIFPSSFNFSFMKMSVLFMIMMMSINTISILMMSWSSTSNYAMIGMMRTLSQLISYEINLMFFFMTMMSMSEQMNFYKMNKFLEYYFSMFMAMPLILMMWMIIILAETNRTPFDFSEGESELVSGFNIEFSGKMFMMLFLSEYMMIMMMSVITSSMFMNITSKSIMFTMTTVTLNFLFIWMRTTMPRFRYDKLMKMSWTQILPTIMMITMISLIMKPMYTKKYNQK